MQASLQTVCSAAHQTPNSSSAASFLDRRIPPSPRAGTACLHRARPPHSCAVSIPSALRPAPPHPGFAPHRPRPVFRFDPRCPRARQTQASLQTVCSVARQTQTRLSAVRQPACRTAADLRPALHYAPRRSHSHRQTSAREASTLFSVRALPAARQIPRAYRRTVRFVAYRTFGAFPDLLGPLVPAGVPSAISARWGGLVSQASLCRPAPPAHVSLPSAA
jgi:hypothetical protein